MNISEIVAPTTQKQETWYHGTPYEKGAQNILQKGLAYDAVSYTHLTLPTKRIV